MSWREVPWRLQKLHLHGSKPVWQNSTVCDTPDKKGSKVCKFVLLRELGLVPLLLSATGMAVAAPGVMATAAIAPGVSATVMVVAAVAAGGAAAGVGLTKEYRWCMKTSH